MRSTTGRGFSLIELMIVCAIVGVLAAIAYTAYDAYVSQVRTGEAAAAPADCPRTAQAAREATAGTIAPTPPSSDAKSADARCDSATRRIQDGLAPLDIEIPATGGTAAFLRDALPLRAGRAA